MRQLSNIGSLAILTPSSHGLGVKVPRRKSLEIEQGNNAFVKPVRQDFVKNARLMPMTRCMILLLMGWAGQEQSLETTVGIIAKHLKRSRRQVHRYLDDAIEEGYLYYSRTKDRMGYYTGIKLRLNFIALKPRLTKKVAPQSRRNKDMTQMSDTNGKYIYKREKTPKEQDYLNQLDNILRRNNIATG